VLDCQVLNLFWVVESIKIFHQTDTQTLLLINIELGLTQLLIIHTRLIEQHVTLIIILLEEHDQIGQIALSKGTLLGDGVCVAFAPLLAQFEEVFHCVCLDGSLAAQPVQLAHEHGI